MLKLTPEQRKHLSDVADEMVADGTLVLCVVCDTLMLPHLKDTHKCPEGKSN